MLSRAVLLFTLVASLVVAGPVSFDQRSPEPKTWPTTGNARALPVRRGLTNGQRIARGLAPLTPARLYDASRVHSAPVARLSANPAPIGSTYNGYEFDNCYDTSTVSGTAYQVTANSDQAAVDACAQSSGEGGTFTLLFQGDGHYLCSPGASGNTAPDDCNDSNYAAYYSTNGG